MPAMTFKAEKSRLCREGYDPKDVEVALELMVAIAIVDQSIFGTAVPVNFCGEARTSYDHIASYCPSSGRHRAESYYVVIPGIANELNWTVKNRPIFEEVEKGRSVILTRSKILRPTMVDACISIAAHEVRHRMQRKFGHRLNKFALSKTGKCPPFGVVIPHPLVSVLPDVVQYFDYAMIREEMVRLRRPAAEIKRALGNREFDAYVTELLVLHRMARGVDISELKKVLRKLLWTGPPKKSRS